MQRRTTLFASLMALAAFPPLAHAQDPRVGLSLQPDPNMVLAQATAPAASPTPYQAVAGGGVGAYFSTWFDRVNRAQAEQPHWIAPLVTVTPLLIEQVRYDQLWESLGNNTSLTNYDNGKGLELVPTETNEVQIGAPPYLQRGGKKKADGLADWPFLLVKQRLASANEQSGNYILTAYMSAQADSGDKVFTNRAWILTPTIAGGIGFGDFDVQATLGVALPTDHESTLGKSININAVAQYHVLTYLWPEIEVNYTHWIDGSRDARDQVFLTPGIVLGRFKIRDRVTASIGGGYQVAVSPAKRITTPALTPLYNHAWILSGRVTF